MDVVIQAEVASIGLAPIDILGVLTLGSAQDSFNLPSSVWVATIELVVLGSFARGPDGFYSYLIC